MFLRHIHTTDESIIHSFASFRYSVVYHRLFTHCPVCGHLVCFQFLATVNKAAMTIPLDTCFVDISFNVSWLTMSTIAGPGASLPILENSKSFSKGITSCYMSPSNTWVLHLLYILINGWCNVCNFSPSGGMQGTSL